MQSEDISKRVRIGSVLHDKALDRWIFVAGRHLYMFAWKGFYLDEDGEIRPIWIADDSMKLKAGCPYDLIDPPNPPIMTDAYVNTILKREDGSKALLIQMIEWAKSQIYCNLPQN